MKILHLATDGNQVVAITEVGAMCESRGIPVFLSIIRFDLSRKEEVLNELQKTGYLFLSNAWQWAERLEGITHRHAQTFEVHASHFADYRHRSPRSRYGKALASLVHDIGWLLKDPVLQEIRGEDCCDIHAFTEEAARRAHQLRLDDVLPDAVPSSPPRVRL